MEYLTYIQSTWPADGDPARLAELMTAERERISEFVREGAVIRMWRDPGQWSTWILWSLPGPDELHRAITSLPMYAWLKVTLHPLATHPTDPAQNLS
ncbi:muconolactone delta-isomerase [Streptacidiphilus sp. 4-A2]|nr:muconolactone delta-isomerase [Streptacidiphilus sp. 4-A2]